MPDKRDTAWQQNHQADANHEPGAWASVVSTKWLDNRRRRSAGILPANAAKMTLRLMLGKSYDVEFLYQRSTRRARSVFQRLALPTPVSIGNGIRSG